MKDRVGSSPNKPDPQSFVALLAVELPLLCRLPFGLISHPLPTLRSLFPLKFLLLYLVLLSVDVPFDVARPATDRLAPLRR